MSSQLYYGLDIGSEKTTLLAGQHFPVEQKLNIVGIATQPTEGLKRGVLTDIERLSSGLVRIKESVERMTNQKINSVSLSYTSPYFDSITNSSTITLSKPKSEITPQDKARVTQLSQNIDLGTEQTLVTTVVQKYFIDDLPGIPEPTGMMGSKLTASSLLILSNANQLTNLTKAVKGAGLIVDEVIFSGICSAKAVLSKSDTELGCLLLDIGGNETTVMVYQENALATCFVIPMGGKHITNDLAIGLRLTLDEAENLKRQLKEVPKDQETVELLNRRIDVSTAINGIIKPRVEDILKMVLGQLSDRKIQLPLPGGIILTGGGAHTPNIMQISNHIFQNQIKFGSFPKFGGLIEDIEKPEFASSLGLLLYLSESKHKPRSEPKKDNLIQKLKQFFKPFIP